MRKVNRVPHGTFKGNNFMTPDLEGFYSLHDGRAYAEISSGRGFSGGTIYGCTFRLPGGERMANDPSRMCETKAEALALIEAVEKGEAE